jgi:hypothetical protein
MTVADRIIRWTTAVAVIGVAAVAAVVSYKHAPTAAPRLHDGASAVDPLGEQAAVVFAAELAVTAFPRYVPSARRSTLASRAHSGCVNLAATAVCITGIP